MIKAGLITRVVSKLSPHGNVSVTDQILRLCYHYLHPPEMIHYISSFHIVDSTDIVCKVSCCTLLRWPFQQPFFVACMDQSGYVWLGAILSIWNDKLWLVGLFNWDRSHNIPCVQPVISKISCSPLMGRMSSMSSVRCAISLIQFNVMNHPFTFWILFLLQPPGKQYLL